jgi:5-methylcytosine-specific restriction endonuclease McrA
LFDLPNLKMQAATNYRLTANQALRLDALWSRTGRDWTWNESVAGLWAYAQTYGQPVSKLPGTPVSNVALLVGRAVTGVYAKVMNFRSIDPRARGAGMSGAGEIDRIVWNDFFDAKTSALRMDALASEFKRIWSVAAFDAVIPPELNATEAIVEDEAGRLEELDLEKLIEKYAVQIAERPRRPSTRMLSARAYERNPLVIAIARMRASYRCEVQECAHPPFEISDGVPYTEVHHIVPLAEGGEDSIENVACLCAAHHREVHLGTKATELTEQLKAIRANP